MTFYFSSSQTSSYPSCTVRGRMPRFFHIWHPWCEGREKKKSRVLIHWYSWVWFGMWKRREKTDIEMSKKERELWMLRNGGLLLEKRISYFDDKYSNPIRNLSDKELQKAIENCKENLTFGRDGLDFTWYKGSLEGQVISLKYRETVQNHILIFKQSHILVFKHRL